MPLIYTTDHEEIRAWVNEHGGKPAMKIESQGEAAQETLDVAFIEGSLVHREVDWAEFFDTFESQNLRFHYESKAKPGEEAFAYGFDGRDEPVDGEDDETELPDEVDGLDDYMFPSSPAGGEDAV